MRRFAADTFWVAKKADFDDFYDFDDFVSLFGSFRTKNRTIFEVLWVFRVQSNLDLAKTTRITTFLKGLSIWAIFRPRIFKIIIAAYPPSVHHCGVCYDIIAT